MYGFTPSTKTGSAVTNNHGNDEVQSREEELTESEYSDSNEELGGSEDSLAGSENEQVDVEQDEEESDEMCSSSDDESDIPLSQTLTNSSSGKKIKCRKDYDIYNGDWNIKPRSIMDVFQVSGKDKGAIGIKKIRRNKLREIPDKHRKLVVRVFKTMIAKMATSILPEDPQSLVSESFALLDTSSHEKSTLEKCLATCLKGTQEKRLLRSMAVGCYSKFEAKRIISRDVKSYNYQVRRPSNSTPSTRSLSESFETRHARVKRISERIKSGNIRRTIERALNDWKFFEEHGRLPKLRRVVTRVTDGTIDECVRFIYSPRNRRIMATGSRKIDLADGTSIILPQVIRRTSRNALYEEYQELKQSNQIVPPLGKTSFFSIIGRLTFGQQRMKNCLDYNLGVLIFENVKKLESIVDKCVYDAKKKEELQKQITAISDFLKHDYMCKVKENGDSAFNARRALVGCDPPDLDPIGDVSNDDDCLKPFQVIESIRSAANRTTHSLTEVLDDCALKFKLFMAHQLRCQVQQSVLSEDDEWLQREPAETAAIITVDYKMKYIPKKYREKQTDFFGKKGMSWHGTVVTIKPKMDGIATVGTGNDGNSNSVNTINTKNIYFDHICRNDTSQKALSTASILELVA